MAQFTVTDFTTQQANIKGENTDILSLQVPRSYSRMSLVGPAKLYIPLGQYFTVANSAASAATPTLKLDYAIAAENADHPIGTNVWLQYSTDGNTFNDGTKVTAAPAADGEYQILSEADGTIKVYVPASATRYFRIFFRPRAGRLSLVRRPSIVSVNEVAMSLREFALASLHQADQLDSATAVRFSNDIIFMPSEFLGFRLLMANVTATQSSETNITKTVTREALFVPYTLSTVPWDKAVGLIDIPFEAV